MLFYYSSAVLAAALLIGGGTHAGFLGDVALQLFAIPLLCIALWPAFDKESPRRKNARLALWVCGIAVLVSAIQLFPLPFDYWRPGSAFLPQNADGISRVSGVHRVSLTPEASWFAALSLTVPLSIFAASVQLGLRDRLRLCLLVACIGAASLALGFLQVAQGPDSSLRFYEITNPTEAVGFFANRNHFAALLNVTLVLAALWLWITAEAATSWRVFENRSVLWLAAAAAFLVADTAGLAMARSRAGVAIAVLALLGIVLMTFRQGRPSERGRGGTRSGWLALAAAVFAVLFAVQFGLGSILSRFEGDPLEDARFALNRTTFKAALDSLPFGTGFGSFVRVYATAENSGDVFAAFANRAHNDAAELLLETGILGAALLLVFLVWYARRTYSVWVVPQIQSDPLQTMLERAASLIAGLLLLHSLADYPLRTAALGAVFSFFCAVLTVPPVSLQQGRPRREKSQPPGWQHKASPKPAEPWGADTSWPESWQKKQP